MRRLLFLVILLVLAPYCHGATALPIKVSSNHRYFTDANGVPWIMVGDSAHTGICNLAQSAWNAYFQDRVNQGFNTIDLLVLDTGGCASTGAAKDGTLPFTTGTAPSSYDLSTPNSAFWTEVDSFVSQAASFGLVVSFDPMAWGNGFAITYQNNGTTKVFNFGVFIGNRYKNSTNIIWHAGQDFDHGTQPSGTNLNLMAQLMAGIKSVDANHIQTCQLNFTKSFSNQVIGSNATYDANLDFDFVYTYFEVYDQVLVSYASSTTNPTILGETNYEAENNTGALSSVANDFITRQEMWYAMTSGAAGHIFGNGHVNHFDSSYLTNLDTVATGQVRYLSRALAALPWWTFAPDNTHALLTAGFGTYNGGNGNMYNATYVSASWDGANYAVAYTPAAATLTFNMAKFAHSVTASWYDPSKGIYQPIAGSPFTNSGTQNFATPGTNGVGANDWVLVLASTTTCNGGGSCNVPALDSTTVQTSLNAVNTDGTTLILPAAASTWTATVTYNQAFSTTIQGQGVVVTTDVNGNPATYNDLTAITDLVSNSSNQTFTINTAANKTFRLTGVSLLFTASQTTARNSGIIGVNGNSHSVRVDNSHFNAGICCRTLNVGSANAFGVIDHNLFDIANGTNVNQVEVNGANWNGSGDGTGDASWAATSNWGTSSFIFAENNAFISTAGATAFDIQEGGRAVFRYNTLTNTRTQTHSLGHDGATGRDRGPRAWEFYKNVVTYPIGPFAFLMDYEGGTSLYWGNNVSGFNTFIRVDYRRETGDTYTQGTPPNGWGYCGTTHGPSVWDQNLDSTGQACLDGVGRGKGDLIVGASFPGVTDQVTGTQTWPNQVADPVYVWSNTIASGAYFGADASAVNNRDYYLELPNISNAATFNGTAGIGNGTLTPSTAGAYTNAPNCTTAVGYWDTTSQTLYVCTATNTWTVYYTPFTYPHPLIGGSVPVVTIVPSPVNFSNQWLGTQSSGLTVTVLNSGAANLVLSTPYDTISGTNALDFTDAGTGTCANGTTLAPGVSCTIVLRYFAKLLGSESATLTVNGNASGSAALQGSGINVSIIPQISAD